MRRQIECHDWDVELELMSQMVVDDDGKSQIDVEWNCLRMIVVEIVFPRCYYCDCD